jgi:hypothetical protein
MSLTVVFIIMNEVTAMIFPSIIVRFIKMCTYDGVDGDMPAALAGT